MGLRIHPREEKVRRAISMLKDAFDKVTDQHGLTDGEQLKVLSTVHADFVLGWAKFMIREERHGNYDRAGGLVSDDSGKKSDDENDG